MIKHLILILFASVCFIACKNASFENEAPTKDIAYDFSFSKEEYYKQHIISEFNNQIELNKLNDTLPSYSSEQLIEIEIPTNLSIKDFKLEYVKLDSMSRFYNPDYEFNYKYQQIYYDSINDKTTTFSGIISIDEQQQIINQDTLNTIKIKW